MLFVKEITNVGLLSLFLRQWVYYILYMLLSDDLFMYSYTFFICVMCIL